MISWDMVGYTVFFLMLFYILLGRFFCWDIVGRFFRRCITELNDELMRVALMNDTLWLFQNSCGKWNIYLWTYQKMVIFNSYVSLPEGMVYEKPTKLGDSKGNLPAWSIGVDGSIFERGPHTEMGCGDF